MDDRMVAGGFRFDGGLDGGRMGYNFFAFFLSSFVMSWVLGSYIIMKTKYEIGHSFVRSVFNEGVELGVEVGPICT